MKHIFTTILGILTFLSLATITQAAPFSWDFSGGIVRLLAPQNSAVVQVPSITASSSATNTLPVLDVTSLFRFNGVTGSTWSTFCTTITGSAALCDGDDAAGAGALSTSTVRAMFGTTSPATYNASTGIFGVDITGNWSGTFDSQEGTYYLSRANHTGTQATSTITNFNAAASSAALTTLVGGDLTGTVANAQIASLAIVNADISASAAIALSKLATDPLARANHTGTQATATITGIFAPASGGTGVGTTPSLGQVLIGQANGTYAPQATNTLGISAGVQTVYFASTSVTTGQGAFISGPGTIGSVATGTLTTTVTGLQFDNTRALWGGAAILSLTAGYGIPLTASTTNWNDFYASPSNRITAGTNLSWAGNTLNAAAGGGGSNWTVVSGGLRTSTTTDYAQAAYVVASSTTGTSTFAGRVGIGIANPLAKLHVSNGVDTDAGEISIALGGSVANIRTAFITKDASANGKLSILSSGSASNGSIGLFTSTANERLTILQAGNVGVGTVSPSEKLDVRTGNIALTTENVDFDTGGSSGAFQWYVDDNSSGENLEKAGEIDFVGTGLWGTGASPANMEFRLKTSADVLPDTKMVITSDGLVGIATATPSARLTVAGSSGGIIATLVSDTGTKFLEMLNTGATALQGAWDFTLASLNLPNGSAPTVDAIGEIALDTTDNQLLVGTSTAAGAPGVLPITQQIGSFILSSTSFPFFTGFAANKTLPFKIQRDGYVATEIYCDVDGGTSIAISFSNGVGDTSSTTCGVNGTSLLGLGANATVAAGATTTLIRFGAVSGTPDYIRVSVFGVFVRE